MIQQSSIPVNKTAKEFEVSPRAYYKWKNRKEPIDKDVHIRKELHNIALEFPKYGYRRMTVALYRKGKLVNNKRVLRLMGEEKLLVKQKKSKPISTQSNHNLQRYPNLVKDITLTNINQAWVADITYISLGNCFVYLAVIMELFSRKCVGWALSRNPNTQLTLDALNMAVALRGKAKVNGCIHHSDHGVQYLSKEYIDRLNELGIKPSMGEVGNSYDNAFAESFIKTIKSEEVWMKEYETIEDVYRNIKQFLEEVYNKKRLHSGIGYKPPMEFEKEIKEVLNTSIEA